MKLTFFWESLHGRLEPYCRSDTVNDAGFDILSDFLSDYEGVRLVHTIPWTAEWLERLEAIMTGQVAVATWYKGEGWAVIGAEVSTLFFFEEDNSMTVATVILRRVLTAWLEFMQSTPDANATMEIEL